MKSIQDHLKFHSEALALRSQRNEVLASNIANAATPNFKAKDLKFDEMLNVKLGLSELQTSDSRHFAVSVGPNDEGIGFRQNITPSQDGNTVELHVEQMQFSENVMRYQTSLEFLNRKIAGLRSAIKGE
ncbi:MAG: flagellar basal body rod protein FlgB [Rhodobacterales bacterium]|nr:flagellar basal body rod protein FlgB [Rhodobacterales bacterium]NCW07945.1 flagellar basal body rod protein FlgB [Rhodobacterales bacterium]NCX55104.1 flagellar basal body rod protein FlgB [Rhodobacterales bacterium]NCX86458.1 flagellar basal body rod protein FlgB [Paracoccaceae bacterium]